MGCILSSKCGYKEKEDWSGGPRLLEDFAGRELLSIYWIERLLGGGLVEW